MSTVTKARARVKPLRTVRLTVAPIPEDKNFVVTICEGKKQDDYICHTIPVDYGTGFVVEKVADPDQKSYHVNLYGKYGSCECRGHLRWGHCRHVGGLLTLRKSGKL